MRETGIKCVAGDAMGAVTASTVGVSDRQCSSPRITSRDNSR